MQLQSDLWIEGPYYVDFNAHGELRIVGPGNHLYCGLPGIGAESFSVDDVRLVNGQLKVVLHFKQAILRLHDPVIRDVRHIRALTEGQMSVGPSFAQLIQDHYEHVAAEDVKLLNTEATKGIAFRHYYGKQWYGCRINLGVVGDIIRHEVDRTTEFSSNKTLILEIVTEASNSINPTPEEIAYQPLDLGNFRNRADFIRHVFNRTSAEITHLLSNRKTSGYSFGTIFPRDWMESATLGAGDFAPHVIDMMFRSSLTNVSPDGRGWHEDAVGEGLYRRKESPVQIDPLSIPQPKKNKRSKSIDVLTGQPDHWINREMLDIEARYILGLPLLSKDFWTRSEDVARVRSVARYIVKQATEQKLLVLRNMARADGGGWRDSERAYGTAERPIADFAINAVFYPAALRMIKTYQRRLGMRIKEIDSLITKWDDVRTLYRYRTKGGQSVYALALQGVKELPSQLVYRRYEVTHTDEAYLLLYLDPSEEEVASFAERLLSSDFFYTASGPTQVGNREPEFSSRLYHGKVIWTKQTGIISAAITRQLSLAKARKFSPQTIAVLKLVIEMLYHSALTSFQTLGEIPELHYDDYGRARFFDDQIDVEVSANKVQLWSAVGARRIIRDYHQQIQGV